MKKYSYLFLIPGFFLWTSVFQGCKQPQPEESSIVPLAFASDQKSTIYSVIVDSVEVPVTVVPNVGQEEAEKIAREYKKLPEYCWIDSRYITAHYVHFASDTTARIELKVSEPVKEYTIYPKRTHVSAEVSGNMLSFILHRDRSSFYLVSVNHLPMFVILMESPEAVRQLPEDGERVSLKDFYKGTVTDYSEVFRKAIDSVNGTGKTLVVPPGEYLTGEICIEGGHDFNIFLAPGSLIKIRTSPAGENLPSAGILMKHCHNIRIFGNGCLDHQAYENFGHGRNDYHYGFPGYDYYFKFKDVVPNSIYLQSPLMLIYSQNITVEGLLIRNGRNYNVNSRHCDNIVIRNVKVITPAGCVPENTDGINIGSYHNFRIENSFVYCNDDCFSMGHNLLPYDNRSAEGLVIDGLVGWNPRANGIRLGWACNTYIGDILIKNSDFSGFTVCAMMLHKHTFTGREDPDSLAYATVRLENCTFDDVDRYTFPLLEVQNTVMKSLELVNVSFDTLPAKRAHIYGDEEKHIGTFLMKNVRLGSKVIRRNNYDKYFETQNIENILTE